MATIDIRHATKNLLPVIYQGKTSIDVLGASIDSCKLALLNSVAVAVTKDTSSHAFFDKTKYRWADQYTGLTPGQLEAVYVTCLGESSGAVKAGSTQALIDKLVKALPPLLVDKTGKPVAAKKPMPWLAIAAAGVVGGGVLYFATRKHRR